MIPTIHSNYVNFTSGLNKNLLARGLVFNSGKFQHDMMLKNNIDADFAGNKPVAFCLAKVCEIFDLLKLKTGSKLFNLKFPRFRAYDRENLLVENKTNGFCIPETRLVLKNELPFETGSVFQEKQAGLEEWDYIVESDYNNRKRSSGHFLADTIHEIMHSVYIDFLYRKHGYNGKCPYTKSLYPQTPDDSIMRELQYKTFSNDENLVIRNVLGEYASRPVNQYHEVFAETFTKAICESLSEQDALPTKNPFEILKKYPPEFFKILYKVINI